MAKTVGDLGGTLKNKWKAEAEKQNQGGSVTGTDAVITRVTNTSLASSHSRHDGHYAQFTTFYQGLGCLDHRRGDIYAF